MSGVRSGSCLQQLQDLRHRITVQIEHAVRHQHPTTDLRDLAARVDVEIRAEGGTPPTTGPATTPTPPRRRPAAHRADALMADLGVTAGQVKAWAVQHGLLDAVRRGRVASALVDAYAVHHRLSNIIRKAGTP